ncbi:MAG: glycosyltransferase family 2 protein [bacterium]
MINCRDFDNLVVAIPAYNAEKTLGEVLKGIQKCFAPAQTIVIDDGSHDGTAAVARQQGVQLLQHERNRGKGAALRTAFEYILAKTPAPAVISLDADGQHRPEELPKFIEAFVETSAALIIGCRNFDPRVMPWERVMSNRITSRLLSWKVGQHIRDSQSGYRLYSRSLLEKLALSTSGYETESEIIIQAGKLGARIEFVSIDTVYNGETSYIRGVRDIGRFIRLYLSS